jgi:GNAT superfamily N-acetyltransferase
LNALDEKKVLARRLLSNEEGFGRLFSNYEEFQSFSLFSNPTFSEDPIFNHFVLNEIVVERSSDEVLTGVIEQLKKISSSLGFNTTVFLENLWNNSRLLGKLVVDNGFRVRDKMEILSKHVDPNPVDHEDKINVRITEDYANWNRIFVSSFQIPVSWNQELLRREEVATKNDSVRLILGREPGSDEDQGCLLSFLDESKVMGVYCVGTLPRWRGRGIGKMMMNFVENNARDLGCKLLTLQTINSDGVSPMYKKMGYRTEFERDIFWNPPLE